MKIYILHFTCFEMRRTEEILKQNDHHFVDRMKVILLYIDKLVLHNSNNSFRCCSLKATNRSWLQCIAYYRFKWCWYHSPYSIFIDGIWPNGWWCMKWRTCTFLFGLQLTCLILTLDSFVAISLFRNGPLKKSRHKFLKELLKYPDCISFLGRFSS